MEQTHWTSGPFRRARRSHGSPPGRGGDCEGRQRGCSARRRGHGGRHDGTLAMILRPTATVRPQPAPESDLQLLLLLLLLLLAVAFGVVGGVSLIFAWVASGDILQLRLEGAWEEP